jgi:hypothetical protein
VPSAAELCDPGVRELALADPITSARGLAMPGTAGDSGAAFVCDSPGKVEKTVAHKTTTRAAAFRNRLLRQSNFASNSRFSMASFVSGLGKDKQLTASKIGAKRNQRTR